MKKYEVELIMSDIYTIEADSEKEAEEIARDMIGCDYWIDEVKIKEIKK